MNWIQQNVYDRGVAFEEFMEGRRRIILELQTINTKMKKNPPAKKKIILETTERSLLDELQQLELKTEQRLNEIRERRKARE